MISILHAWREDWQSVVVAVSSVTYTVTIVLSYSLPGQNADKGMSSHAAGVADYNKSHAIIFFHMGCGWYGMGRVKRNLLFKESVILLYVILFLFMLSLASRAPGLKETASTLIRLTNKFIS